MENKKDVSKWIIVIILVIVIYGIAGKVSEMLDVNMRSARYLVLAIFFLGWYFIDIIRNRKK